MPNYGLGKIYKIWDNSFTKCYIGSSTEVLSCRMGKHRLDYKKKWLNGIGPHIRVYDLFDEFGVENCKIELLENYPCNSRSELEAREGYHQRLNDCVNKNIAGRTTKEYNDDHKEEHREWYEQNKEARLEYAKNYQSKNKQLIAMKSKAYREKNKQTIAENKKIYYQMNKEKFSSDAATIITCECGCEMTKSCKTRHLKSKKHKKLMDGLDHTISDDEQDED